MIEKIVLKKFLIANIVFANFVTQKFLITLLVITKLLITNKITIAFVNQRTTASGPTNFHACGVAVSAPDYKKTSMS